MITAQDSAPSSAPGHDPQRIAALATAGLALCEEMRAPGATLAAVLQDGSLIRTAVGFDNVFTHTPMTADRRMLGGSTGKSFVAATALALAAEGLVDLDAPVERWLGDTAVFAHLPNAKNLTLRLLLQHSGGLPDHMGSPGLMPKLLERFEREGPDSYLAPIEALELVADLAPINRAGHGFFYSDTGFILAGITLEIATGRTLYELVRRHVLDRLGLTNTEPAISRHLDRLATAHLVTADAVVPNLAEDGGLTASPRTEWAGGGFVTTAADLAVFIHRYAGGTALDTDYFGEASALNLYSNGTDHVGGYGLGLFAAQSRFGPTFGHGGYFPGYISQMLHFPELRLSVAYQVNASQGFDGYADIVETRRDATQRQPGTDAALTRVEDAAVRIAAALVDAEG